MIITGRSVRESEEEVFFALSLSFGRVFFFTVWIGVLKI